MEELSKIGIIGFGIVGRSIHHAFAQNAEFRIYDIDNNISQNTLEDTVTNSEFIYVCVPTPMNLDGTFDSSIIDSVMEDISKYAERTDKIVIIKSTILPGMTDKYFEKYRKNIKIIFSPEFLTERSYLLDAINPSRIIFGLPVLNDVIINRLLTLYKPRFPQSRIYICDAKSAELVKYISNCFFATKLSYFNEIFQICKKMNLDYNRIIKMVLADGRIGNSHWQVPGHDGDFGWGRKCFPKDINALITFAKEIGIDPTVMEAVWKKNKEVRKVHDWEEKP